MDFIATLRFSAKIISVCRFSARGVYFYVVLFEGKKIQKHGYRVHKTWVYAGLAQRRFRMLIHR